MAFNVSKINSAQVKLMSIMIPANEIDSYSISITIAMGSSTYQYKSISMTSYREAVIPNPHGTLFRSWCNLGGVQLNKYSHRETPLSRSSQLTKSRSYPIMHRGRDRMKPSLSGRDKRAASIWVSGYHGDSIRMLSMADVLFLHDALEAMIYQLPTTRNDYTRCSVAA